MSSITSCRLGLCAAYTAAHSNFICLGKSSTIDNHVTETRNGQANQLEMRCPFSGNATLRVRSRFLGANRDSAITFLVRSVRRRCRWWGIFRFTTVGIANQIGSRLTGNYSSRTATIHRLGK